MPPHNVIDFKRPRTIANVLLDLKEARREWEQADKDGQCAYHEGNTQLEDEAGDRMSAIDQRIDELQDEFKELFHAGTGVSWAQVQSAIEDAVL